MTSNGGPGLLRVSLGVLKVCEPLPYLESSALRGQTQSMLDITSKRLSLFIMSYDIMTVGSLTSKYYFQFSVIQLKN